MCTLTVVNIKFDSSVFFSYFLWFFHDRRFSDHPLKNKWFYILGWKFGKYKFKNQDKMTERQIKSLSHSLVSMKDESNLSSH